MEPKKDLKVFKGFTEKKTTISNVGTPDMCSYEIEIPLGDELYIGSIRCDLPAVNLVGNIWQTEPIKITLIKQEDREEDYESVVGKLLHLFNGGTKINIFINKLNNFNEVLNTWYLTGCFCSEISFLYDSEVELTLHYDNFILN